MSGTLGAAADRTTLEAGPVETLNPEDLVDSLLSFLDNSAPRAPPVAGLQNAGAVAIPAARESSFLERGVSGAGSGAVSGTSRSARPARAASNLPAAISGAVVSGSVLSADGDGPVQAFGPMADSALPSSSAHLSLQVEQVCILYKVFVALVSAPESRA